MAPTTEDLRTTLHDLAEEHPAPAPRDLLADLRKARSGRARGRLALGAAAAAATVLAATVGWQALDADDAPSPADGTGSPADRGWVLEDGQAPEQADGLLRLGSDPVAYDDPGEVALAATEGEAQRYAVLWCDVGPDDPAVATPSLRLTTGAGEVALPCVPEGPGGDGVAVTPVPLPPEESDARATWLGDVPAAGEAVLGVYREASTSEYSFPGWPDPVPSPPSHADAVVVDPSSAAGGTGRSEEQSIVVTLTATSTLELWRGVPGGLEVEVDGVRLTDDGSTAPDEDAWRRADPELRGGVWTAFTAGQVRAVPLPDELLPPPGESRRATVTVVPRAGDQHWQVAVLDAEGGPDVVRPGSAGDVPALPEWHAGHRLAATWQVPGTGAATTLELPPGLTEEPAVVWLLRCPPAAGQDLPAAPVARLTVDGTVTETGCLDDLDAPLYELEDPSTSPAPPPLRPGSTVAVSTPAGPEGTTAVVAAYVPVAFEDFDFGAATPPAAEGWAPAGDEVASRLGPEVLVDGASQDLELPDAAAGVRLTTEGVGRVRLLLDGAPALGWGVGTDAAGWWTSWTDGRASGTPLVWSGATPDGQVLTVEVEGYAPGTVELEVLVGD